MFKVYIDISLFTKDAAFGMLSGHLTLAVLPQVGEAIAFHLPEGAEAYLGSIPFNGMLHVTHRIFPANGDLPISLALEDLTAATPADALKIIEIAEKEYGLFGDVWEP